MTYGCRDRPLIPGWKDDGRCQHDSARDEGCEGCWQRKSLPDDVPTDGSGGLEDETISEGKV